MEVPSAMVGSLKSDGGHLSSGEVPRNYGGSLSSGGVPLRLRNVDPCSSCESPQSSGEGPQEWWRPAQQACCFAYMNLYGALGMDNSATLCMPDALALL